MRKTTTIAATGATLLLAGGLLAGCAAQTSYPVKENTATPAADQPALATVTTWADAESGFADVNERGRAAAADIAASNVKERFVELAQAIESNVPALEAAAKDGMGAEGEQAARTVYEAAATLEALGENSTDNVGVYIADLAHDAKTAVGRAYDGQVANFDLAQSEVTENYDKAMASSEESWNAFAASL